MNEDSHETYQSQLLLEFDSLSKQRQVAGEALEKLVGEQAAMDAETYQDQWSDIQIKLTALDDRLEVIEHNLDPL